MPKKFYPCDRNVLLIDRCSAHRDCYLSNESYTKCALGRCLCGHKLVEENGKCVPRLGKEWLVLWIYYLQCCTWENKYDNTSNITKKLSKSYMCILTFYILHNSIIMLYAAIMSCLYLCIYV